MFIKKCLLNTALVFHLLRSSFQCPHKLSFFCLKLIFGFRKFILHKEGTNWPFFNITKSKSRQTSLYLLQDLSLPVVILVWRLKTLAPYFSLVCISALPLQKKKSTNTTLSLLFFIKEEAVDYHVLTQFAIVFFQYLVLMGLGHKLSLTLSELLLDVKILLFCMKR